ncbi:MAG: ADP-ribosylglycohydrolase family protein [Nanoarchaeota archaeon]
MKIENFTGTLLGCAIGDTLGMVVEGWDKKHIQKYAGRVTSPIDPVIIKEERGDIVTQDELGPIKYHTIGLKRGQYTDDTILTLALAESVAEHGLDLDNAARKQVAEYEALLLPNGKTMHAFGWTTVQAFKNLQQGVSPLHSGVYTENSGNAPPMKMSPVGMYMAATGLYNEGIDFAEKVSRMTHLNSSSIAGGVVQAHAVYSAMKDVSRNEFVNSLPAISRRYEDKDQPMTSRLEWIAQNMDADCETAYNYLGCRSPALESYPFAAFMFQKHWDRPLEGLIETVNYGGDCDTTGAIYGALAGAKSGLFFPKEWLCILEGKQNLIEAAERIYSLKR